MWLAWASVQECPRGEGLATATCTVRPITKVRVLDPTRLRLRGLLGLAGYFFAFLACRFSFSVF